MRIWRFTPLFLALSLFGFERSKESNEPLISQTRPTHVEEWQKLRTFFQENGYLWIKNYYSKEQVHLLTDWADEIHGAAEKILKLPENLLGTLIVVPEATNPKQVCRTEDMLSFFPDLGHFIEGTLTSYLGKLLGEPYVLFKEKLNFKWPGGGAFTPHQDFPAFDFLGPREHVTAMIAIDEATLENGCLQVALDWRGTFAGDPAVDSGLLEAGRAVLPYVQGGSTHGSIQPKFVEKISWLALNTSPGDLVLISSFVPHYSEPNQSQSSRRALFFTLNKLKEGDFKKTYYHTKRNDPDNPTFHFATPTKARTK